MPDNGVIIPTERPTDLATFTVKIDGEALPRAVQVLSVRVNNCLNKIPTAKLIISDGDTASASFQQSESELFRPGLTIEISAGYHSEEEVIFSGVLVSQKLKFRKNSSSLVVTAKDPAFKMTLIPKYRLFNEKSDKEAAEEVLGIYGLSGELEDTFGSHEQLVQNDSTDWDFILMRSEMNGLLLSLDNGTLTSFSPDPTEEASLVLAFGSTMMEADLEIDSRFQTAEVVARAWSHTDQEIIEEQSSFTDEMGAGDITVDELASLNDEEQKEIVNPGQTQESELTALGDAYKLKRNFSKIRGTVTFQGLPSLKPGDIVELQGLGSVFNGNTIISAVAYEICDGKFISSGEVGIDPDFFSKKLSSKEKNCPLPSVSGIRSGIVLQLEEDPKGENRILVHIPMMHPEGEGIWARVSTLDAGEERGSFFLPEIDDEVIVGFVGDDPRHGVVLGMVHSSAKPAPLTAADDNFEKGFITKSEMKILFNDDTKTLTVSTPNGNSIVLDEDEGAVTVEDENSNSIKMSSDGIEIDSCKDIKMTAAGDITVEGVNINAAASAEFKAEGSAGAEISTGAVCTVKGSLVKIN